MRTSTDAKPFVDRFTSLWRRTDSLFGIVARDAILSQPIALRHPFIFYVGHLPAFAWNHICRGVLQRPSFNPRFDEIFDRGIDPDVDDPSNCHAHPEVPAVWPSLDDVIAYRDRVRTVILESLPEVAQRASTNLMAERNRVLSMAVEHELMHQETLLYIVQQLESDRKLRSPDVTYATRGGIGVRNTAIDEGEVTLGALFDDLAFGWDNEFPSTTLDVPAFVIDSVPVTNEQFQYFVETGAYNNSQFRSDEDWAWKNRTNLNAPISPAGGR